MLIDPKTRAILAEQFRSDHPGPAEVVLVTSRLTASPQQDEAIHFTRTLLNELAEIDPRIRVTERTPFDEPAASFGVSTVPSLIFGADRGLRLVYNGTPAGQEGQTLVGILRLLLTASSGLSQANEERLRNLTGTCSVRVFVTLTCPFCPAAALLAAKAAYASGGKVAAEIVEAEENPDLSRRFGVSSVPMTVFNDDPATAFVGAPSEDDLVERILRNLRT